VPLLALYGLEDVLVSPQRAHELAAAPRATVEPFDCGHLLLEELPDETMRRIRTFLVAE